MLSEKEISDAVDAEQAYLGALLTNNAVYDMVEMRDEYFYEPLHVIIFQECEKLIAAGFKADPVSLKTNVPLDWEGMEITVPQYCVNLVVNRPYGSDVRYTAETIKDFFVRVSLQDIGEGITQSQGMSNDDVISDVEDSLSKIHTNTSAKIESLSDTIDGTMGYIDCVQRGEVMGTSTGLQSLDKVIGNIRNGEYTVLAGRPSMGKTAFALQIAANITRQGFAVLFFSLEMKRQKLMMRLLAEQCYTYGPFNIHYFRMDQKDGLKGDEYEKIYRAGAEIEKRHLIIDDNSTLTMTRLKTSARQYIRELAKKKVKVGAIFVDYLQLMSAGSTYRGHRVNEVSELTRMSKNLAGELNLPLIALSQLSRNVESRENKRPMLSDLRESGSIEQDADNVIIVYRPEYYWEKEEPEDKSSSAYTAWQAKGDLVQGSLEAVVAKNRNGPTGIVRLQCDMGANKVMDEREV